MVQVDDENWPTGGEIIRSTRRIVEIVLLTNKMMSSIGVQLPNKYKK